MLVLLLEEPALGLCDAEVALVTVITVDSLFFSAELLLPTVTMVVNVILSPDGADFGTTSSASAFGVFGLFDCSETVQLALLVQPPTVNVGGLKAGVLSLRFTVVVIVPFSLEEAQAEILNRTVPPGCTLLSEAATARDGCVSVGVGDGDDVGLLLGGGLGLVVEVLPLPEPDDVLPIVGVGVADAVADALGLAAANGFAVLEEVVGLDGFVLEEVAELDGLAVELAELDGFTVVEVAELDGFTVVDGVAVGVGVAAKAVAVTPLEITKRPVARPSVTGRVCADGIRTPCLCWLSRLGDLLFGIVVTLGTTGVFWSRTLLFDTKRGARRHPFRPAVRDRFRTVTGVRTAIRHWAARSRGGYG